MAGAERATHHPVLDLQHTAHASLQRLEQVDAFLRMQHLVVRQLQLTEDLKVLDVYTCPLGQVLRGNEAGERAPSVHMRTGLPARALSQQGRTLGASAGSSGFSASSWSSSSIMASRHIMSYELRAGGTRRGRRSECMHTREAEPSANRCSACIPDKHAVANPSACNLHVRHLGRELSQQHAQAPMRVKGRSPARGLAAVKGAAYTSRLYRLNSAAQRMRAALHKRQALQAVHMAGRGGASGGSASRRTRV